MSGRLTPYLKRIRRQVKHLIFPPLCYHCSSPVEMNKHLICKSCFDLLTLIDPKRRCSICFAKTMLKKGCHNCPHQKIKVAAACSHQGPLVSLLHQLKYNRRFALAPALAPLLAMQWYALKWPQPDLIIPIPQTPSHRFLQSYNPSHLLAESLSTFLSIPVVPLLKRAHVLIPQNALPYSQRKELSSDTFQWNKRRPLADLTLLIIDDTLVTGATLRQAAARLFEEAPAHIYGLTLSSVDVED